MYSELVITIFPARNFSKKKPGSVSEATPFALSGFKLRVPLSNFGSSLPSSLDVSRGVLKSESYE